MNFSGTVGPSVGVNLRNSTRFSDRSPNFDDDRALQITVKHNFDGMYYRQLEGSAPEKVKEFVRIVVASGENWEKAKDVFLQENPDVVGWIGGIGKGFAYLGAAALIIAAVVAAVWFILNDLSGVGFADDAVGYAVVTGLVNTALKLANAT